MKLNYIIAILCLRLQIQSFTIHAAANEGTCDDIYVDVNKCSIDIACSPFQINDVMNDGSCQDECQNSNRECKSWIYSVDNVGKTEAYFDTFKHSYIFLTYIVL